MEQIYIGMVDCARGALADCLAEACLDDAERQRFERIRLPLAKRCFAEGRRLARQMTAALTARDPASLGCVIDPRGKPRFADLPDWHFSITHSGTLVACACSALALGLDA
jgi:4'-phosphopantetheinyl transferase